MLEDIKVLLGITSSDKDSLLNILIMQCTDDARDYTHNDKTWEMNSAIVQLVIFRYNQLGTEGLNSESYSGLSYNYKGYEEYKHKVLKNYRKIRVFE